MNISISIPSFLCRFLFFDKEEIVVPLLIGQQHAKRLFVFFHKRLLVMFKVISKERDLGLNRFLGDIVLPDAPQ